QAFAGVNSKTMACLASLAGQFYGRRGRKQVPRALFEETFASEPALLLAAWFLDDGCYAKPHGSRRGLARLATHGYARSDVLWLARIPSGRRRAARAGAAS